MSRAYRITVNESETRRLSAGDEIGTRLELLEILPPEDMATLLRQELKARGFDEQPDGTLSRTDDGVTVTIDPCSGQVTATAEAEATVSQEAKREASGFNDVGPAQESLRERVRDQLKAELDKKFEQEQARLQAEATGRLERHLQDIQPEISEVVNKVTRDALKQKAQQMGTVTEVNEDQAGNLTIKIEV